ncbi:N-acetyltransferase [Candidatus Woesearchaeota archaeon]|nr:N-acetyltransferase [Candidatus Woesearchaeota archaeon]
MSTIIHKNVKLTKDILVGEFCIIGILPRGRNDGELEIVIGGNSVIRSHTIIYAGNKIGDNFQTGHDVFIREENIIGNNVSIGTKTVIEHHVTIEDDVRIHCQCFIPEFTILKKGCWIGPKVVFTNAPYPSAKRTKEFLDGAVVEENAKIGANSTILPGIKIGKNALIGAGSVVTKDVPAEKVVAGNPAKIIKDIKDLKWEDGSMVYE